MAEPVYKKITELDTLSASLDGNETLPVVKSGKTYKRSWANLFGSGWISWLLGAFSAFKAPDANHADDSDTVGGESTAQLHNAANLTGAVPLASIPAELTGKNAATATTSAACSGNAATATLAASATKWGSAGLKVATFTGTTAPGQGSGVLIDISSVTTVSKVVCVFCTVKTPVGGGYYQVLPGWTGASGYEYNVYCYFDGLLNKVGISNSISNSSSILSKPFVLNVVYTD